MGEVARPGGAARQRRLAEELAELGVELPRSRWTDLFLEELDYALRPVVHERRVPSVGAIIEPVSDPGGWEIGSQLAITHRPVAGYPIGVARRFADGLSSFVLRRADGKHLVVEIKRDGFSPDITADLARLGRGEAAHTLEGKKAVALKQWEGLNPDKLAYHVMFADGSDLKPEGYAQVSDFIHGA